MNARPDDLVATFGFRAGGAAIEMPVDPRGRAVGSVFSAWLLISGSPPFLCTFDEVSDNSDQQDHDEQQDGGR